MIRVVIVDDHAVVRIGLRALLMGAAGVEIVGEASDGASALKVCADLRPDVVVMDLAMQGVDGLEAMRQLVRRPEPPRILALTMHDEEDYLVPALEAGASGYIVKAAASTDLLDAIRTVAAGRTWVRPSAAGVLAQQWVKRAAQGERRADYESLSDRERDVFRLTAEGHSAARIGDVLHVSPKTVETYRRRVNEKLGISERSEYIRLALELGVLTPEP